MKPAASTIALALLICSACQAQTPGSICIAPVSAEPPTTAGSPDLFCRSAKLSLKIDSGESIAWPHDQSQKLTGFDLATRHQVVVFCDDKPQQTFKFRFTSFKGTKLCLFINDMYQTVQLWEDARCPWCKCI